MLLLKYIAIATLLNLNHPHYDLPNKETIVSSNQLSDALDFLKY